MGKGIIRAVMCFRVEDIEAEAPREESVSAGQKTDTQDVCEVVLTEVRLHVLCISRPEPCLGLNVLLGFRLFSL